MSLRIEVGLALSEDVFAQNAAALTHIELMRTMIIVGEFIFAEAILGGFGADGFGDFGIVLQKPDQAFVVGPIAIENFAALEWSRFGPSPVLLGQIKRLAGRAGVRIGIIAVDQDAIIGKF